MAWCFSGLRGTSVWRPVSHSMKNRRRAAGISTTASGRTPRIRSLPETPPSRQGSATCSMTSQLTGGHTVQYRLGGRGGRAPRRGRSADEVLGEGGTHVRARHPEGSAELGAGYRVAGSRQCPELLRLAIEIPEPELSEHGRVERPNLVRRALTRESTQPVLHRLHGRCPMTQPDNLADRQVATDPQQRDELSVLCPESTSRASRR